MARFVKLKLSTSLQKNENIIIYNKIQKNNSHKRGAKFSNLVGSISPISVLNPQWASPTRAYPVFFFQNIHKKCWFETKLN